MLSSTPTNSLQVNSFLNITINGVATSNPANIQHILLTNFSNYIKGSRFHTVLDDFLGDGISNADGHIWTVQRKIASHEFSTKSLKLFISDVVHSEVSNRLLPFLDEKAAQGTVFDLQQVLQTFGFRSICRVAFGVEDPDSIIPNLDLMKSFDDAVDNCFARVTSPFPAYWKLKRFLNLGSEKRFREAINNINEFALHVIKSKEEKSNQQQEEDLLSRFMQGEEKKHKFLRDIVISFMLAGKDTTSTALTWFFWLIAGNPRCVELIHKELSAATAEENSKVAVEDDVLPDGTEVRKGMFADYSAYAVGRMEKVWGGDCLEFKPERWLVVDEDGKRWYKAFDQFKFPVFHCGPRMCLGKEMAYIQMKAIVAAVMMEFEVLPVGGGATAEKMMKPPYSLSLLLKMRGGLPVTVRRRHRSN
ncbi:Cytochrome P450 94A1 [Linum grandiflorum]